jgi:hypothetical protein
VGSNPTLSAKDSGPEKSLDAPTEIWRKHVVEESQRRRRVIEVEYGADDRLDAMSFDVS